VTGPGKAALRRAARLWLLALPLTVASCDSPAAPGAEVPRILSFDVDAASGPIFRTVVVRLDRVAHVEAEYGTDGLPALRVRSQNADTLHRLFLPRLRAQRSYTFAVRGVLGDIAGPARSGSFTTAPLPDSLALLEFAVQGAPTLPVTLLEVWFSELNWRGLVAVDAAGEIVWYWKSERNLGGVRRRANGNFVLIDGDKILELTPARDTVRLLPRTGPYGEIHHDLEVTPDNTVLFLARDPRQVDGRTIVGEAIWEWHPEPGTLQQRWTAWDHFSWPADSGRASEPGNWLHTNSLTYGVRGNLIVSARNTDQVFSIAPDFSHVEWRLGGPNASLPLVGEDRFYSQHSPVESAPDRILLFDNGLERPWGDFSRVLELEIDVGGGTAHATREFRPTPDNFALRVGSVRRLPNGHTVATFGWGDPDPVEVFELDASFGVVWHLVAGPGLQRAYRGTPWASLGGEFPAP
jgi:hypothetical protein